MVSASNKQKNKIKKNFIQSEFEKQIKKKKIKQRHRLKGRKKKVLHKDRHDVYCLSVLEKKLRMDHDKNVYIITNQHTPIRKHFSNIPHLLKETKRKRKRKRLCIDQTLQRYYDRIKSGPLRHHLHELEGAYLSTFQMFSTENELREKCMNNAFVLMRICHEEGINVKGVTSECKIKGQYISDINNDDPQRNKTKIVYVDSYNYFTNHKESKWTIQKEDKVYLPLDVSPPLVTPPPTQTVDCR